MTDRSPDIAVGLRAAAVAMKAKARSCRDADVLCLMSQVLALHREDEGLVHQVLAFEALRHSDMVAAGAQLLDYVCNMADEVASSARNLDECLAAIEQEPEFDWQNRLDING